MSEPGRGAARAQLPLLDRLMDDAPDEARDPPMSSGEALDRLRMAVRRDLQNLLNARRVWRVPPAAWRELPVSPLGYGLPDYAAGAFNEPTRLEELRREVENTIRRFEPRFMSVEVKLSGDGTLSATLRLRIEALLHAEPAPEQVSFDTVLDLSTDDVLVREARG